MRRSAIKLRRVKRSEASFSAALISFSVGGLPTGSALPEEVALAAAAAADRAAMRDCRALSGWRALERLRKARSMSICFAERGTWRNSVCVAHWWLVKRSSE